MCGIAGIVRHDIPARTQETRLRAMQARLRHRGPDGEGVAFDACAALAHTRLALLDREGGAQPMVSPDGRHVLVYNGQVYNYRELREELRDRWTFRTNSDTEVVLAAATSWGPACLERLNGMFAFFLWDRERGHGFAARDRLGVKPFVYRHADDEFLFASEAKAILAALPGRPRAHREAVLEYLVAPCFSGVERPMFEGLEHLPAGHWLEISAEGLRVERWWDYRLTGEVGGDPDEAAGELRARLETAVRRSLAADVPVGLFLSGGLDSTFLAALARPKPLSFTIQFEGQEKYDYAHSLIVTSDDTPFARMAAAELGLEHRIVPVERAGLLADLDALAAVNDALPAWEQEFAQYHLSREAARHRKAVLVGDAADETHFGYPFLLDEAATRSPAQILRRFSCAPVRRDVLADPLEHFARKYMDLAASAGHRWGTPRERTLATTYLVVKRWLARLLHNGDIHAMAWGLEARVPFGDADLLDLVRRIDPQLGFREGVEKWLLRRAGAGLLPEAVRLRRKSALPKDQEVQAVYQHAVAQTLDESPEIAGAYLEVPRLRALCDPARRLSEPERMLLFRTIALASWARQYEVEVA